jgi:hypothetical protein
MAREAAPAAVIDNHDLRATLLRIHPGPLTSEEARAILDVTRRAAAADHKTDIAEMTMLLRLKDLVAQMADEVGLSVPGRIEPVNAATLSSSARELAFACAYLVMNQDLALVEEERALTSTLASELRLGDSRTQQLIAMIDELIRSAAPPEK